MAMTKAQDKLSRRAAERDPDFCAARDTQFYETPLSGLLPDGPDSDLFDDSCFILSVSPLTSLPAGLRITGIGKQQQISGLIVWLDTAVVNATIQVGRDNATVIFERDCLISKADIRLFRDAYVRFGSATSVNSALLVVDNGLFTTGEDCMFSSDVTIQVGDQHSLWSIDSDRGVSEMNKDTVSLRLERHVWIGRGSMLIANNSVIHQGSIVGAGAVVASDVSEETAVVGNPAKVVRSNVTWSRNIDIFTAKEVEMMNIPTAPHFKQRDKE